MPVHRGLRSLTLPRNLASAPSSSLLESAGKSENCASDTPAYAARVVVNALHLINGGANALIVWEGADQYWSNHEWGLMMRPERGSKPRPVYHALATAFSAVPVDAKVLRFEGDSSCALAGFRKADRIVFVGANGSSADRSVRITVTGVPRMRRVMVRTFGGAACSVANSEIKLNVPRDGVIAVTVNVGRDAQNAWENPVGTRPTCNRLRCRKPHINAAPAPAGSR